MPCVLQCAAQRTYRQNSLILCSKQHVVSSTYLIVSSTFDMQNTLPQPAEQFSGSGRQQSLGGGGGGRVLMWPTVAARELPPCVAQLLLPTACCLLQRACVCCTSQIRLVYHSDTMRTATCCVLHVGATDNLVVYVGATDNLVVYVGATDNLVVYRVLAVH